MGICSYSWEGWYQKKCQYETWEESDRFCIFHDPSPQKNINLFKEKLKEHIDINEEKYSFIGFVFPENWNYFENYRFETNCDFSKAVFQGNVIFDWATFEGKTKFSEVIFQKDVTFISVNFHNVSFFKTIFKQDVDFDDAKFKNGTNFSEAVFKGQSYFRRTSFKGPTKFSCTIVKVINNRKLEPKQNHFRTPR